MSKLVMCKTCGAEIAKSAKRCPQCGAKQPVNVVALIISTVIVVIFAVIIISLAATSREAETPTLDNAAREEVDAIEISAVDLYDAYAENAVRADGLYKDKVVNVTGTISNITQDILTGNPCVVFDVGDIVYSVQCFFSEDRAESVASLNDGQTVTISGTCTGLSVVSVQLSRCVLVN